MPSSDPSSEIWRFSPGRPSADASVRRAKHRQCTGEGSPRHLNYHPQPHRSKRAMP